MTAPTLAEARELLTSCFGYPDFRPGQQDIIQAVLEGRNVLAILPTGGGKSICYQLPALLKNGLTIVISPLIALMQDQVDGLARAGIRASFINSMLDYREVMERLEKAYHGWYKLLYVAPERFESMVFLDRIRQMHTAMFVVDEAHCISEWGHDFRPSYTKLRTAIDQLGVPQVLAFTATATPDVRQDIRQQLGLVDPVVIVRGFDRPNLSFRVLKTANKREFILTTCSSGESGVVYAGTRNTVEEIAGFLAQYGISAEPYHAGLPDDQRRETQARFIDGRCRVIVATSAFGMGIDKPDVRFVLHHDMPMTIEQYYQEAGRAGRDGGDARCIMLHQPSDKSLPEFFIRSGYPDRALLQSVYTTLHNFAGTELGASTNDLLSITPQMLAAKIGNTSESAVRSALDLLERHGHVRRVTSSFVGSRVRFLLSTGDIRQWLIESAPPHLSLITVSLLRMVGGEAFYDSVIVDLDDFSRKSFLAMDDVVSGLKELASIGLIAFSTGKRGSGIALIGPRMKAADLDINHRDIELRMRRQRAKLLALERYIDGHACRRNMILEYFEERDVRGTCGRCDNCEGGTVATPVEAGASMFDLHAGDILACVAELDGRFGRTIIVDVLRGAKTQRIDQYQLARALSYGRARKTDKGAMLETVDMMIGMGLLAKSDAMHSTVSITELGRERLGRIVRPLTLPPAGAAGGVTVKDPTLYEALRAVRRRIAGRLAIASHALLPDPLLAAIANAAPEDKASFLAIDGVGPAGFQKYGREMLKTLREHAHQHTVAGTLATQTQALATLTTSVRATLDHALRSLSLEDIAFARGLSEGTISQHICEIIASGLTLDIDRIVPPPHQQQIRKAVERLHLRDMKKIKAVVDADVTYASIRIMLAVMKE